MKGSRDNQQEHYFLQRKGKDIFIVNKNNFRADLKEFFIDYPSLSMKIKKRLYNYNDLHKIVEEYNTWIEKKDELGRDKIRIRESIEFNQRKYNLPRYGIEIPMHVTRSYIFYPDILELLMPEAKGGMDYSFGIGLKLPINKNFSFKGGFQHVSFSYNPEYSFIYYPENERIIFTINEDGTFSYTGIYFKVAREWHHAYSGLGLNISLNSAYKANYFIYDENGALRGQILNSNETFFTNQFIDQVYLEAFTGTRVKINNTFSLLPNAGILIPTLPIFYSGAYHANRKVYKKELNPYAIIFRAGINVEINFK